MLGNEIYTRLQTVSAIFTVLLFVTSARAATHETVLHIFNPTGVDAVSPYAGLISDAAGNLYGTTTAGGTYNVGAVFELIRTGGMTWTEKVLYSFKSNGIDGTLPFAGLVRDAAGNLYGTTFQGGSNNSGTVFEMMSDQRGGWTEQVLHNFNNGGTDGAGPVAALIFDAAGNLYGTTESGGTYGYGTVFELSHSQQGWTEQVLHSFNNNVGDGVLPVASLTFDAAGNLYGTTFSGGTYGHGTAFGLTFMGGAWTEQVLHNFGAGTDGTAPDVALVSDAAGNLYGTTFTGGTYSYGTVFELTFTQGAWTEQVLHNFNSNGTDGASPEASLIRDALGNLYGTTFSGGTYGQGTAFELTFTRGAWTEQVLHNFKLHGTDGASPIASLIRDAAGNLYGTSFSGGTGAGTVFQLTPAGPRNWTEKVLYTFGYGMDGDYPVASLIFDAAGDLYGTTAVGGAYNYGTVFELTPTGPVGWTEKVLYNFGYGADGARPVDSLIFDAAGNLYGTTYEGGAYNCGTVFELRPTGRGGWTERVLYSFNNNGTDGSNPEGGLVFDRAGNLYGTTNGGGAYNYGTVFELTPAGGGTWTEAVLHSFNYDGTDGYYPTASLIFDGAGNLYGTTQYGGSYGNPDNGIGGTVFVLTNSGGGWIEGVLNSFGNGTDGFNPSASLVFDAAGNLYGTTFAGGTNEYGTVFELLRSQGFTEQVLYNFGVGGDGNFPYSSLIFDAAGNLYGTTEYGGTSNSGTVFELTLTQGGTWIETLLHNFSPTGSLDGASPNAGVVFDHAGSHLYGTTSTGGGLQRGGAVFQIGP